MKVIFEERLPIGLFARNEEGELFPVLAHVWTKAHYDKKTNALVVEQWFTIDREWAPADRRFAELAVSREAALRRVIGLADAWQAEVAGAVPAEPEAHYLPMF